jgi:hypothetical protein
LSNGESLPCSAECVTVELIGSAAELLDPALIHEAAAAVLHYFRHELGRTAVSVGEFSEALEVVLRSFGLTVKSVGDAAPEANIVELDLRTMACESGKGYELTFFKRLRAELHEQLRLAPQVVRFNGLRGCVKQLTGARHWSRRCQQLNDQIVEYLRLCWTGEPGTRQCAMVVE